MMTNAEIEALCETLKWRAANEDDGDISDALTAIRQLQQPWQRIESAPREENWEACLTNFLLLTHTNAVDDNCNITVGFWGEVSFGSGKLGWCNWAAGMDMDDAELDCWQEVRPTHWMPLPPSPEPGQ